MTIADYSVEAAVVAVVCVIALGVLALRQHRHDATVQTEPLLLHTPGTTKESHPVSLLDYRKLIDDLHTESGCDVAIAIEIVDANADSHDGHKIRASFIDFAPTGDPLSLTEHDAGALYDALGGAMRALAALGFTDDTDAVWLCVTKAEAAELAEITAIASRRAKNNIHATYSSREADQLQERSDHLAALATRLGGAA